MDETDARVERVVEEISGNESLLEMLETEAAEEMLNWGTEMATSMVEGTKGMEDADAEEVLQPRLKALRRTMRSVGNWAAGQYKEPADRVQLREKLLENFKIIYGEDALLPSPEKMDESLSQVDDPNQTPHQLIIKLRRLLQGSGEEDQWIQPSPDV